MQKYQKYRKMRNTSTRKLRFVHKERDIPDTKPSIPGASARRPALAPPRRHAGGGRGHEGAIERSLLAGFHDFWRQKRCIRITKPYNPSSGSGNPEHPRNDIGPFWVVWGFCAVSGLDIRVPGLGALSMILKKRAKFQD